MGLVLLHFRIFINILFSIIVIEFLRSFCFIKLRKLEARNELSLKPADF